MHAHPHIRGRIGVLLSCIQATEAAHGDLSVTRSFEILQSLAKAAFILQEEYLSDATGSETAMI